jgi:hypothetical protein
MNKVEKHLKTKLNLNVESFRFIFEDWTDNQRLEVIKSVIWTAPDVEKFLSKVQNLMASKDFNDNI